MVDEKGILTRNIYKVDETGFHIGVSSSQWIITLDMNYRHYSPLSTNRDYYISVKAISGNKIIINLLIIIKDVIILEK